MKGIAVLGMGRSGTKFLAEALEQSGCYVGEVNWAYENHAVRAINDELLARYCGAQIGKLPYGHLRRFPIPAESQRRAKCVVEQLEAGRCATGSRYWLFKDPRTTLLGDLWLQHVDVIVCLFRRPSEVIESYIQHRFIDHPQARSILADYWLAFNCVLLELVQSQHKPTFLLHFDAAIDAHIDSLVETLGLTEPRTIRFQPGEKHFNHSEAARSGFETEESHVNRLYHTLREHCAESAAR